MAKCRCPKCGRFLPKTFCSEVGGDCPRCGYHVKPTWYTWAIERRPWPTPETVLEGLVSGELRTPFESDRFDPDMMSADELKRFINVQLGIEFADDRSVTYHPLFSEDIEGEHPDVEISAEVVNEIVGMIGFDQLHNALLIHFGIAASAVKADRWMAIQAANVAYYAAMGAVVGGNTDKELLVEHDLREQIALGVVRYLAEAVEFICSAFDIPFTPSLEYMKYSDHPKIWRW